MKKKQASGGARLTAAGKKPMTLGLDPADRDLIERAAAAERMPMTVFVLRAALVAAKKTLKNPE